MKLLTDTDYIHALIAEGEHQQQDFKFEISDARKIAKTLSAFANTNGGRLLIGVKDNGKIAGVRSEEEKYMIEAAAQLYCVPEVEYSLQTYIVEGRQVLVATIEETPHKPVYAKDETGKPLAYLRIKDENILATPIHLRVWQQSDSPRGELIRYTEREQLLLDQLEHGTLLSLNRYCRGSVQGGQKRPVPVPPSIYPGQFPGFPVLCLRSLPSEFSPLRACLFMSPHKICRTRRLNHSCGCRIISAGGEAEGWKQPLPPHR